MTRDRAHTFRRDALTGDWVVIARARRGMPRAASLQRFDPPDEAERCPFCPGHEAEAEAATQERRDAQGRWIARAVRNRFPLVRDDDGSVLPPSAPAPSPVRERLAYGAHEVLIETREHGRDLGAFTVDEARVALELYRDRARALGATPGARCVVLFRNRGARAGSSQPHPHAQCLALPLLSPQARAREARARAYHRRHGVALLTALVDEARRERRRVIDDAGPFVALAPWAPHRTFETWIAPVDEGLARTPFSSLDDAALAALAPVLLRSLARVAQLTGDAAYNLILRQPSLANERAPWARWHVEILPRMGGDAGFELTTRIDAVTVDPDDAAELLRGVPLR